MSPEERGGKPDGAAPPPSGEDPAPTGGQPVGGQPAEAVAPEAPKEGAPGDSSAPPDAPPAAEGEKTPRNRRRRRESSSGPRPLRVRHGRLHAFVRQTLTRSRLLPELASQTADALVGANLSGWDEDGAARLPEIVDGLSTRHLNASPSFRLAASSGGAAVLDGGGGPGPAVAHRGMTEAISAANRHGVGAVAVRGSNRFGAPGHFARLALPHQMIGVAVSSGPAPPPGKSDSADTGAGPAGGGGSAPVGYPAAFGIAVPTAETAPPLVLNTRLEDPARPRAGGDRSGSADLELALALEALTALAGAALPAQLVAADRPEPLHGGTGQLFLAFRVRAFAPWAGFRNRMVERLTDLRRRRIPYPGQTEGAVEEERRTRGIPLDPDTAEALERLSYRLELNAAWEKAAV